MPLGPGTGALPVAGALPVVVANSKRTGSVTLHETLPTFTDRNLGSCLLQSKILIYAMLNSYQLHLALVYYSIYRT